MYDDSQPRAVVLVEGASDRVALETLAERLGRNLRAENVAIVAMGGVTNFAKFISQFGPPGLDLPVAGLCDAGEEAVFCRGLELAGLGTNLDRAAMESLGFYVCDADLEDEFIRCLGTPMIERVIEQSGEIGPLRTFQQQPAQQGRSAEAQLRRFMGTRSGRKARYARLLVEALDLAHVPRPLHAVLGQV
jgi:hypothetical protein